MRSPQNQPTAVAGPFPTRTTVLQQLPSRTVAGQRGAVRELPTRWLRGRVLPPRDPEVPLGINTTFGAVVMLLALVACALVPAQDGMARLGLLCTVLAWFAWTTVDPAAVLVVLAVTCLVGDGFLVNRGGELSWQGGPDAVRIGALALAGLLGLVAGRVRSELAEHRRYAVVREWS